MALKYSRAQGRCAAHIVLQVEAHEGVGAGSGQLRQVPQVAHGRLVELEHLRVEQILVPQSRVAGQHLRQDHHLQPKNPQNLSGSLQIMLSSEGNGLHCKEQRRRR